MYEVYVGNVGTVATTHHRDEANRVFNEYVRKSVDGDGAAAGEPVTLMEGEDVLREHPATPEDEVDETPQEAPVVTRDSQVVETLKKYMAEALERLSGSKGSTMIDELLERLDQEELDHGGGSIDGDIAAAHFEVIMDRMKKIVQDYVA